MLSIFFQVFLFFCSVNSEHMSSLPTLPSGATDPSFPSPSLGLPSATPSPSLGLPSVATPASATATTAASRVENSGPRPLPPHLGFTQSKDVPSAAPLTVSTKWENVLATADLAVISPELIVEHLKGIQNVKLIFGSFLLHRMDIMA